MKKINLYTAFLYRYRFLILWIAFLTEFVAPAFDKGHHVLNDFVLPIFSILAGINVLLARRKLLITIVILGLFVIVEKIFNDQNTPKWLMIMSNIILLSYYVIIVYEIFKELLDFSKVDFNTIGALLAGFFIGGIMGGVVFTLLELNYPNSFAGISLHEKPGSELVYFSFVTLTTIGYGDISPVTQLAQRVTVLFGLLGNFYSTIIIGVIISKFISSIKNDK